MFGGFFLFGLGLQELLIILVLALIFFGADKIPQLARTIGKGMSEFRKAQREMEEELNKASESPSAFAAGVDPIPTTAVSDAQPPAAAHVTCPACGGKTVGDSSYCSQCGHRMQQEVLCRLCHRHLREDEKFCPNCGQAQP